VIGDGRGDGKATAFRRRRPEAWVAAAGETVDVRALIRRTVTTAATRATAG
jgi:hypothetical protein